MQIVIDIDEDTYKDIKRGKIYTSVRDVPQESVVAIANGNPLPKGHGRLIDADVLGEKLNRYTEAPYQYALAVFNESPTIIEADMEREDKG